MRHLPLVLTLALAPVPLGAAPLDRDTAGVTERTAPDGGRHYDYPPNTGAILRPQDRTAYDRPGEASSVRKSDPPGPKGLSQEPAERVGK